MRWTRSLWHQPPQLPIRLGRTSQGGGNARALCNASVGSQFKSCSSGLCQKGAREGAVIGGIRVLGCEENSADGPGFLKRAIDKNKLHSGLFQGFFQRVLRRRQRAFGAEIVVFH